MMARVARLMVRFQINAAHHLPHHEGACANLHGHTWRGKVTVIAPVDESTNMAMDFAELKRIVDAAVPDHTNLNELLPSPTCETFTDWLVLAFRAALPRDMIVEEVELWESDRCGVRVCAR